MKRNSDSLNSFADEVLQIMPLMVREFAKREDNALFHGQISCPQMVVLHHTVERGSQTVSDIANMISTKKSSASVLVDRLVRQKMLSRKADAKDRRVIWISATEKGRKVVSQIMRQKRESFKAIFGKLTAAERSRYLSVLRKVKVNLLKGSALVLFLMMGCSVNAHAFLFFHEKTAAPATVSSKSEPQATKPEPLSLQQAYNLALKRSEKVGIAAEEIAQAQARFYRSFDYFLPTVSFEVTRFQQDVNDDSSSGGAFDFSRQRTPTKKFVFSQPLFSGFKEFAALAGSGADKKEQVMKLHRAKELLYVDVMEAYYTVLHAQKDVDVFFAIHQIMSSRLKGLKERVNLGRSRDSEFKSSLAEIKILESDLVDAKRDLRNALSLLEFYIGEDMASYSLVDENGEKTEGSSHDLSLSQKRSDVNSYEQAYIVAEKAVIAANAHFFPKVSLDGNYYTQRVGFQSGNDWDVTLKFDVPVFEVGQTLGDVKEAASNRQKAKLTWEQSKRMAYLDAKNTFQDFMSSMKSEQALGDAERASKDNYKITMNDFNANLVNNLEVLDSLRRYQDVERRYQGARYETKKNYWKLKLALGEIKEIGS